MQEILCTEANKQLVDKFEKCFEQPLTAAACENDPFLVCMSLFMADLRDAKRLGAGAWPEACFGRSK